MSDTGGGTNGSGAHGGGGEGEGGGAELLGRWLGKRLGRLRSEMSVNRQRFESIELRLDGLSRVLLNGVPNATGERAPVVLLGEHAGQVADVISEAASLEHQQGELLYVAAEEIRRRAKTHH